MAISRAKKEELVGKYVEQFNESQAIIFTDYRGLKVGELQQLRAKIREVNGSFSVIKNTLVRRALTEAGLPIPDEMLIGPAALGFCHDDVTGVAKAITEFAKDNEMIKIKGGIMGGKLIDETAVRNLARLPSLDVLRAQLLGLINTPASQVVGALAGGVRQVVSVLQAYSEQGSEAPAEA